MGWWSEVKKKLGIFDAVFQWSEPSLFLLKLRGDMFRRCMVCLGIGGVILGAALFFFTFVGGPSFLVTLLICALFGGFASLLTSFFLFWGPGSSGQVKIGGKGILRVRGKPGLGYYIHEESYRPPESIRQCVVFTPQKLRQNFAVMDALGLILKDPKSKPTSDDSKAE